MTQAQDILTMIESIRPDDEETLSEIDARVWCLKQNRPFNAQDFGICPTVSERMISLTEAHPIEIPQYTRSLDACYRAIPDKWVLSALRQMCDHPSEKYCAWLTLPPEIHTTTGVKLPTLPIAITHSIVQAIDYERRG